MGGIVYLLSNGNGHYKIGVTKGKISNRIKQLQTGNSSKIECLHEYATPYYRKVEITLHNNYVSKRLEGEWFNLTKEDILDFIPACQRLHESFKYLEEYNNPFI